MVELIATIILFTGLIGVVAIIIRKIPILSGLSIQEIENSGTLRKFKEKIKNSETLKSFSGELLLQKILSKIRVLTLRTENKTATWLTKLRQRTLKKKNKFSDDYWKKIKKRK